MKAKALRTAASFLAIAEASRNRHGTPLRALPDIYSGRHAAAVTAAHKLDTLLRERLPKAVALLDEIDRDPMLSDHGRRTRRDTIASDVLGDALKLTQSAVASVAVARGEALARARSRRAKEWASTCSVEDARELRGMLRDLAARDPKAARILAMDLLGKRDPAMLAAVSLVPPATQALLLRTLGVPPGYVEQACGDLGPWLDPGDVGPLNEIDAVVDVVRETVHALGSASVDLRSSRDPWASSFLRDLGDVSRAELGDAINLPEIEPETETDEPAEVTKAEAAGSHDRRSVGAKPNPGTGFRVVDALDAVDATPSPAA